MSVPPRRDLLFWTATWLDHDTTAAPAVVSVPVVPSAPIWRRAFFPVLGPRIPGGLRYEESKT